MTTESAWSDAVKQWAAHHDATAPRSVAFRVDWEPDPEELRAVRDYLLNAPEQGGWSWEGHCEGLAGGILQALHVLATKRVAGANPTRPSAGELAEPERQRYIAQARRLGQHVERLKAENGALRAELAATQRGDCPSVLVAGGIHYACDYSPEHEGLHGGVYPNPNLKDNDVFLQWAS